MTGRRKKATVKVTTIDLKKVSLEPAYVAALGQDRVQAQANLRFLSSACAHGRTEATVFLMGFLVNLPDDDWEMRIQTVEALGIAKTERCAALLFSELRRVRSSNTTRRYLSTIIDVLKRFPIGLVEDDFLALASDKGFSQKMRLKFREAARGGSYLGSDFGEDEGW